MRYTPECKGRDLSVCFYGRRPESWRGNLKIASHLCPAAEQKAFWRLNALIQDFLLKCHYWENPQSWSSRDAQSLNQAKAASEVGVSSLLILFSWLQVLMFASEDPTITIGDGKTCFSVHFMSSDSQKHHYALSHEAKPSCSDTQTWSFIFRDWGSLQKP